MKLLKYLAPLIFIFSTYSFAKTIETNIPSDLNASEFNHVSSTYMPRPTFVTLNTKKNGKTWLDVTMERYGTGSTTNSFTQENCDKYIEYIDKYFEWESIALRDADIIEKKIGKAKNVNLSISFYFFSGNEKDHYLAIGYSKEYSQYFSHAEAAKLKALLLRYKNNELKVTDTSKYN
jgi:hypothetical protein